MVAGGGSMRNHQYNRPITIEKYSGGTDAAYNQEDRTRDDNWDAYWSGFCREVSRGTNEFFRTARLDSRIDRVFKVRWNPQINDITSQDYRVQFEGKTHYLTGAPEDEQADDRELSIACTHWQEVAHG